MAKNSLDIGSNHIYDYYIADLDSFEKAQGYLLSQKLINAAVFDLNKKLVENKNSHSGGYIASFKWLKSKAKTKNIFGYKFVPVKQAKRDLAKAMKDPLIKVDFFEKK